MKYLILILATLAAARSNAQHKTTWLFVGTYTDGKPANGIYVYKMNGKTGSLTGAAHAEKITNPSFLTIAPNGQFLYACTDTKTAVAGSISSFIIDTLSGALRFINKQSSAGANPVYLTVDKNNKFVITGNYTEGNVAVLPINNTGGIDSCVQSIRFTDSSINQARQDKSHIHSTNFSPGYDYIYLPDLGADKIRVFRFDASHTTPLIALDSLTVPMAPGSGPRHMAFHPHQPYAYCIEEMGGMVSAYSYHNGRLTAFQQIASNAKSAAEYSSADIHISPDGLFLYTSNRVENTISIFSIGSDGRLKLAGHQSTMGELPRNFTLDPGGHFLLVANQLSNSIVVFKRNERTGLLTDTGIRVTVPAPSCLQMRTYE